MTHSTNLRADDLKDSLTVLLKKGSHRVTFLFRNLVPGEEEPQRPWAQGPQVQWKGGAL